MERDWARLGRAFAEAREAAGLKQTEVAERIGVTRTPIQTIERGGVKGKPLKKISPTMRSYARILQWTDDSIEKTLGGGSPDVKTGETAVASAPSGDANPFANLPLAIVDQLQNGGPLIEAKVIALPSTRSDVHLTIVVQGEPGASAEEIRDALFAWRKAQRHLQNLGDETGADVPAVNGS